MGMDDKTKGKMNEMGGKMTGDKPKEMKGKAQQSMGDMKDKMRPRDEQDRKMM